MKPFFIFFFLFTTTVLFAQSKCVKKMEKVMLDQQNAWNQADLPKFMEGYWKSDSLLFVGKSGITYGWQYTLNQYKKSYPTSKEMGQLLFTNLVWKKINRKHYLLVGKWDITLAKGNVEGHYSLVWKKIKGEWKIVADHSS